MLESKQRIEKRRIPLIVLILLVATACAMAADQPQWGQPNSRNMTSNETGLPATFNPETGKNIKWIVDLGSETYSTPIVAQGRVFIGTNNERPRDPRHKGDRGVMLCLDERDGHLLWQLVVPKRDDDPYKDWPRAGLCSPPTIEGDRVYIVTNRGEVLCLDIDGLADGNDGPVRDEGRLLCPTGAEPMEPGPLDADILWAYNMPDQGDVYPHDSPHCSILIRGPLLYVNTSNGVDNTHRRNPNPDGPALMVFDKNTGRPVARDREGLSLLTFHCTWSSPALGQVGGRELIFFGGPDGVCYAFEPVENAQKSDKLPALKRVWRFDCDPTAPKTNIQSYTGNRTESPSMISSMPVIADGRLYVTVGGDLWWGKRQAWLKCIDASLEGDVTDKAEIWSYDLDLHCCSTPAVADGLVYAADCGRKVHCVDARTGKGVWVHDAQGEMWGSTLVADGKVYIGTRRNTLWTLAAGREKKVLGEVRLDSPIYGSVTAANGTLYIPTMKKLYAATLDKTAK